jgi:hypothetical protein
MSPRLATSRHVLCTAAADREGCTRVLCLAMAGESAGRRTPAVVIHAVHRVRPHDTLPTANSPASTRRDVDLLPWRGTTG